MLLEGGRGEADGGEKEKYHGEGGGEVPGGHYLAWKLRMFGKRGELTLASAETVSLIVGQPRSRSSLRRGSTRVYGSAFKKELIGLWESFDYQCGKRLAPLLHDVVPILQRKGELKCSEEIAA